MLISHKYKFIFIHIPKTGGTSIRQSLEPLLGQDDIKGSNQKPYHFHATALELCRVVDKDIWKHYFKFAFVRNPWDKLVSQYHYFSQTDQMDILIPEFHNKFNERFKNFTEWIKQCAANERFRAGFGCFIPKFMRCKGNGKIRDFDVWCKKVNFAWFRNSQFITDAYGNLLMNFVGKFERLEEDFVKTCEIIGIKAALSFENRSTHKPFQSFYTEETRGLVEKAFRKDIEMFAYKFE